MRGLLIALSALVLAACVHAPRAANNAPAQITAQLDRFLAGVSAGDASVHDWWWADELIYTSSNGTRFGKRTIVDGAAQAPDPDAKPVTYTAESVRVTSYGQIATLAFTLVADSESSRTAYLNSGTLRLRAGQWQVVQWQATKVPAALD